MGWCELDVLLRYGARLWAIEMKLSSSPERKDLDRLHKVADMVGADKRVLISKSKEQFETKDVMMTNLEGFLSLLSG